MSGTPDSLDSYSIDGHGEPAVADPSSDLATYARQRGISLEAATAKYGAQEKFMLAAAKIESQDPDNFTGAGLDPSQDSRSTWIRFIKRPADDMVRALDSLPYSTRIEYGARVNAKELTSVTEQMATALVRDPRIAKAMASTNPANDSVDLVYELKEGAAVKIGDLLDAVKGSISLPGSAAPYPGLMSLTRVSSLQYDQETGVRGGKTLTNPGPQCTSGFSVSSGSTMGLVTALHCPNNLEYGSTGVIQFVTEASPSGAGNYYDLQWHRPINGNTAVAEFQNSATTNRTVNSVVDPIYGAAICNYGFGTGQQNCANVYNINFCLSGAPGGGLYCGLDSVTYNIAAGGNSGGPWFLQGVAQGIHSGRVLYPDNVWRSIFTPISRVHASFGVTVMTG